jgi:hypothetical protein
MGWREAELRLEMEVHLKKGEEPKKKCACMEITFSFIFYR